MLVEQAAVSVDTDDMIDTRWSDAVSDDFLKNYTRCRTEGRFGLSVYRHRVDRHDRIDRVSAGWVVNLLGPF